MAAGDFFDVKISGKGGHGAMPQTAVDPIAIASQAISAVQTIVGREVDPRESAVVSICKIQAGGAYNIIPDSVTFGGTLRAHSPELRRIPPQTGGGDHPRGGCGHAGQLRIHPPQEISPHDQRRKNDLVRGWIAREIMGADKIFPKKPLMGSEDFSFYLEKVPGDLCFPGGEKRKKGNRLSAAPPQIRLG